MSNQKTFEQVVASQINVKHSKQHLLSLLENPSLPYLREVIEEIEQLLESSTNKHRTRQNIQSCATKGMIAEIAARSICDENGQAILNATTKKYHDCINGDGEYVEIKHWKDKDVANNIQRYLNHDAIRYNVSKYLMCYVSDNNDIWLHSVVNVADKLLSGKSEEVSKTVEVFDVVQNRNSFTISDRNLRNFGSSQKLRFIFSDGRKVVKTAGWFNARKRESNSGYSRGGWYMMSAWV